MASPSSEDRAPTSPARRLSRRASWALALVALTIAGVAWVAVGSSGSGSSSATSGDAGNPLLRTGTKIVGNPLPATALTTLDGAPASLASYRGTPMVVNFWQVDCTPCRTEMPDLERLHQDYGGRVAFVGVNSGDPQDKARANSPSFGVTYDIVLDPEQDLIRSVGGTGLPTTLLVRGDGTVARMTGPGAVDPAKLRGWIDQELLS
jgi:thiol-disulfide isomerase/thioredoxin